MKKGAHDVVLSKQRVITARLTITMLKAWTKTYLKNDQFGTSVGDLLLCMAVAVAQIEGQPISSTNISLAAGMPRATAIRRLRHLVKINMIVRLQTGKYVVSERVNDTDAVTTARGIIHKIKAAGIALSRMDQNTFGT